MIHVRKLPTLAAVALVFSLFVLGLIAQTQNSRIMGTVIGADGKPLAGADVVFERTDIKVTYKQKTTKDGKFDYPTLPKGIYNLTISSGGTQIYGEDDIRTDPVKPKEVSVDLSKKTGASAAATPAGPPKFIPLPGSKLPPIEIVRAAVVSQPGESGAAPAPVAIETGPTPEELAARQAEYDRQKKEYEEALGKVKDVKEAITLGDEAAKGRHFEEGISNYLKAVELDPKQANIRANLADLYRRLAEAEERNQDPYKDRRSEAKGNYAKCAETYAGALAVKPDATFNVEQTLCFARAGNMTEAMASLNRGITLDAGVTSKGYRYIAAVEFDHGEVDQAEADFRKAIEANPENADAYYGLGQTLLNKTTDVDAKGILKAPAGTAEAFQKYLELAPSGANANDALEALKSIGQPVVNHINQRNNQKSNTSKGKGNK